MSPKRSLHSCLLLKSGVEGVVVEWRGGSPTEAGSPPSYGPCQQQQPHPSYPSLPHYPSQCSPCGRRNGGGFLCSGSMRTETRMPRALQGTLVLWFHENRDKDGNPSNKVYGVSCCHVLRKDTTVDYEHRVGAPKHYVRVCGKRRFQRGLDEITKATGDHSILVDLRTRGYGVRYQVSPQHQTCSSCCSYHGRRRRHTLCLGLGCVL